MDAKALLPRTRYGPFTAKPGKSMQGRDGVAWEATLLRDGKPVARVLDEGCGGMLLLYGPKGERWADPSMQALVAELDALAKAEMPVETYGDLRVEPSWETLLATMADNASEVKRLQRKAKTATLYAIPGDVDADGEPNLYSLKAPPSDARVAKYLAEKAPGAVVLNAAILEA